MSPAFLSRLSKTLLLSAAALAVGFGAMDCALAQKGNYIGDVSGRSSSFFSLNLGGRGLLLAALSARLDDGMIDTLRFKDTPAMQAFYASRDGEALWIDSRGRDHAKAAGALTMLERSWTHGLNPGSYHVDEIRALIDAESPADKAQLELLVSDAVIRYAQDLSGFHLPQAAIRQDAAFWRKPASASEVLQAVAGSDSVNEALDSFAPHDALYQRLRQELIALSESPARAGENFLPISFGGGMLRPGEFHKDVVNLRGRLGLVYDPAFGAERQYDDALAAAVMDFQYANGLSPDGIIGAKTLTLLNRSVEDKIKQIIANMERLRWLDQDKPDRYILVNIPSATLWAIEDDQVALEMPVIVGRPERETKSFVTEITGVRFNPKWTVPATIKSKDFLPKLVEDPAYLLNKGIDVYQVVDGQRETVDSTSVDWANITTADLRSLRMVQAAGDNNALGRIRVLMDNPYDIYLHDTNAPEYFKKTDRTLSSGCIRLSNPEAVAQFILKDNKNWSGERMDRILASGKTSEIPAAEKIPVYILYQTIWLDDEGRLVYGPDVYKQDRRMIEAMASIKALHILERPDVQLASTGIDASVR